MSSKTGLIKRLNYTLNKLNAPPLHKGRQQYLAKLAGTTERTIRKWYADDEIPDHQLIKLVEMLDVNLHWLKTGEGCSRVIPKNIMLQNNEAIIPILPWNKVADWLAQSYKINFEQGEYRKICLDDMSENSFILKIELPDLQPYIAIGSLVFIDPAVRAEHCNFVLVKKYDGIKPVIRRYINDNGTIFLESPYPNILTTKLMDLDTVLGVVTQQLTPLK